MADFLVNALAGAVPLVWHESFNDIKTTKACLIFNVDNEKDATSQGKGEGVVKLPITTKDNVKDDAKQIWEIITVSDTKNLFIIRNRFTGQEAYPNTAAAGSTVVEGHHYVWHIYVMSNDNYVIATSDPKDKFLWGTDHSGSQQNIVLREDKDDAANQWLLKAIVS